MTKSPRYKKYKPSDVEWIGDTPEHWAVKKLKYLVDVVDETIEETNFLVAVENIESKTSRLINLDSDKTYQGAVNRFNRGDTLFNKLRPYLAKVYFAEKGGGCIGELLVLRSKGELFDKFLFYRAISRDFIDIVDGSTYGTKMPRANWGDFISQLPIPFPPLAEQQAIASYLDVKCAAIDELIADKRRLMELLREERAAVINRAVTRGLDPKVKLKGSGVDWLGKVPKHWEVKKLKHVCYMKSGDNITALEFSENGIYPVYGGNGIRGYTDKSSHDGEYIIIGRQGALCGNIHYTSGKIWASEHAVVCKPDFDCQHNWLGELLRTMNLNQYSMTAAQPGLSVEFIKNLCIPVPPLVEQEKIASHINATNSRIDSILSQTEQEIELLAEYRTALINEVVTGKVKVGKTEPENDSRTVPGRQKTRRTIFGAGIVSRLHPTPHFGRTKYIKVFYIAEHDAQVEGLGTEWMRMPYGPYDERVEAVEKKLEENKWFRVDESQKPYQYIPLDQQGGHITNYQKWFGDKKKKINRILNLFEPLDTRRSEIIATLYGVWNDLIIQNEEVTEDRIFHEFFHMWHEEKKKFSEDELREELKWMRKNKIVPTGWGKLLLPFREDVKE